MKSARQLFKEEHGNSQPFKIEQTVQNGLGMCLPRHRIDQYEEMRKTLMKGIKDLNE